MKKSKFITILIFALKIFFTVCAALWVVLRINWNSLTSQIPALNYPLAISGFLLFTAFVIPSAARWTATARACGFNLSYKSSVYNYFVSAFFGAFLPRHGCDFVRGFLASRQLNVSFGKAMGSVFIERICGFFVALVICLIGLVISINQHPDLKEIVVPVIIIMCALVIAVILSFNAWFRIFVTKITSFIRFDALTKFFNDIFMSLDLCKGKPGLIFYAVLMSFLNQLTTIISAILLAYSIPGFDAPAVSFFVVTTIVFFTFIIPSIGGYGVTQASTVIVFGLYGTAHHYAAVYSILRLIFSLMVSLIGGLLFMTGKPFKIKDVLRADK